MNNPESDPWFSFSWFPSEWEVVCGTEIDEIGEGFHSVGFPASGKPALANVDLNGLGFHSVGFPASGKDYY